ncbi:Tkl/tkl-ccin protein kinase, partial [Globisporangium splendens]
MNHSKHLQENIDSEEEEKTWQPNKRKTPADVTDVQPSPLITPNGSQVGTVENSEGEWCVIGRDDQAAQISICIAAENGDFDAAADDGISNLTNHNGTSSLLIASQEDHIEVVAVLLESAASVSMTDKDELAPLFTAARNGHWKVAEVLLQYNADLESADTKGRTALFIAVQEGHDGHLLKSNASLSSVNKHGESPLLAAASSGFFAITDEIIQAGASPHVRTLNEGALLIYSAERSMMDTATRLFDAGHFEPCAALESRMTLLEGTLQTLREYSQKLHEFQALWLSVADRLTYVYVQLQREGDLPRAVLHQYIMIIFRFIRAKELFNGNQQGERRTGIEVANDECSLMSAFQEAIDAATSPSASKQDETGQAELFIPTYELDTIQVETCSTRHENQATYAQWLDSVVKVRESRVSRDKFIGAMGRLVYLSHPNVLIRARRNSRPRHRKSQRSNQAIGKHRCNGDRGSETVRFESETLNNKFQNIDHDEIVRGQAGTASQRPPWLIPAHELKYDRDHPIGTGAFGDTAEVKIERNHMETVQWKSPEYLRGDRLTVASDVYAFGMCILEAASGDYPWGRQMDAAVRFQVRKGNLPSESMGCLTAAERVLVEMICAPNLSERIMISSVVEKLGEFAEREVAASIEVSPSSQVDAP